MHRVAVFVDAGYVFAQGSVALTGVQQRRQTLSLDIPAIKTAINNVVAQQSRLPLLRIYWYDAVLQGRPTPEQHTLADQSDIKVRLGQVNSAGEQKGVDALIITDMAELARNKAMADAILISGDEDLRVGVMLAQQFGVRVHLVGIKPAGGNQSPTLRQESDTSTEWDDAVVRSFLSYTQPVAPTPAAIAAASATLDMQVQSVITTISPTEIASLKSLFASTNNIPSEHDRALLRAGRLFYAQSALSDTERSNLRSAFVRLVKAHT